MIDKSGTIGLLWFVAAESAVRDPKVAKQDDLAAEEEEEEDEDEGAACNICMEAWTNSGDHRIASLK